MGGLTTCKTPLDTARDSEPLRIPGIRNLFEGSRDSEPLWGSVPGIRNLFEASRDLARDSEPLWGFRGFRTFLREGSRDSELIWRFQGFRTYLKVPGWVRWKGIHTETWSISGHSYPCWMLIVVIEIIGGKIYLDGWLFALNRAPTNSWKSWMQIGEPSGV